MVRAEKSQILTKKAPHGIAFSESTAFAVVVTVVVGMDVCVDVDGNFAWTGALELVGINRQRGSSTSLLGKF
jgi:hypothetical protein